MKGSGSGMTPGPGTDTRSSDMKLDKQQIEKVSTLARLELNEEEKGQFQQQLSDIITYVEKINELDTSSVEPADHIVDQKNIFHQDVPGQSLPREEIEKVAPKFDRGHFVVPKVIE